MLERLADARVVGEAADGWEAVQKALTLKPDLIVLDIGLPKLNGIKAANRILAIGHNSAKIIFLTQESDSDVVQAAFSTGAQGYVLKTDAGNQLLPAIKAVLRGERFVSSGIKCGPG